MNHSVIIKQSIKISTEEFPAKNKRSSNFSRFGIILLNMGSNFFGNKTIFIENDSRLEKLINWVCQNEFKQNLYLRLDFPNKGAR